MDERQAAFFREVREPVDNSGPVSYESMTPSIRTNHYSEAFWRAVYFVPGLILVGFSKMLGLERLVD